MATFAKADKDGKKKLCLGELKIALLELALDDQNKASVSDADSLEMIMNLADSDEDREITCEELIKLLLGEADPKTMMINMFTEADKDGKGKLGAAEFKELIMTKSKDNEAFKKDMAVQLMVDVLDMDGDKKLKTDEFLKILKTNDVLANYNPSPARSEG